MFTVIHDIYGTVMVAEPLQELIQFICRMNGWSLNLGQASGIGLLVCLNGHLYFSFIIFLYLHFVYDSYHNNSVYIHHLHLFTYRSINDTV